MTNRDDKLDPKLGSLLEQLRPTPARDQQTAARGRAKYLAEAKLIRQAVSPVHQDRHTRWIDTIQTAFGRKERSPMIATLVTILLSVTLLFGGAGATVYAAQSSMPGDLLYPVKTYSEDARLDLAGGPQQQLGLSLDFTNRRADEIAGLSTTGKPIPTAVVTRLQTEIEAALQLAASMDDTNLKMALERIQATIQRQEQKVAQVQARANLNAAPALEQVRLMLQLRLEQVKDGLADPQGFRLRLRQGFQGGQATPGATSVQPGSGGGTGPGPMNPSATPAHDGTGPGPGPMNPSATPLHDGTGPGPGPMNPSATPLHDGTGPGPGPVNPSANALAWRHWPRSWTGEPRCNTRAGRQRPWSWTGEPRRNTRAGRQRPWSWTGEPWRHAHAGRGKQWRRRPSLICNKRITPEGTHASGVILFRLVFGNTLSWLFTSCVGHIR